MRDTCPICGKSFPTFDDIQDGAFDSDGEFRDGYTPRRRFAPYVYSEFKERICVEHFQEIQNFEQKRKALDLLEYGLDYLVQLLLGDEEENFEVLIDELPQKIKECLQFIYGFSAEDFL